MYEQKVLLLLLLLSALLAFWEEEDYSGGIYVWEISKEWVGGWFTRRSQEVSFVWRVTSERVVLER